MKHAIIDLEKLQAFEQAIKDEYNKMPDDPIATSVAMAMTKTINGIKKNCILPEEESIEFFESVYSSGGACSGAYWDEYKDKFI